MDNIFVERLWRSLKYEDVYLHAYASVAEAKTGIGAWLDFYNTERQHQSLGYRTPQQIYREGLWICGRSAGADRLRFPRFPSELGKQGNARLRPHTHRHHSQQNDDVDDSKSRGVAPATAPTMIGADIEIGRATP
jgi:hypothetical protein